MADIAARPAAYTTTAAAADASATTVAPLEFSRVRPGISRLVLLGHAGSVTLEALRWLADVGISFFQIDKDGRLLASSTPTPGDARVRRAQALAIANPTGLQLAKILLGEKLGGQRRVLQRLTDEADVRRTFDERAAWLDAATSLDEALIAEREAAFVYWAAWSPVAVRFRPFEIAHLAGGRASANGARPSLVHRGWPPTRRMHCSTTSTRSSRRKPESHA